MAWYTLGLGATTPPLPPPPPPGSPQMVGAALVRAIQRAQMATGKMPLGPQPPPPPPPPEGLSKGDMLKLLGVGVLSGLVVAQFSRKR